MRALFLIAALALAACDGGSAYRPKPVQNGYTWTGYQVLAPGTRVLVYQGCAAPFTQPRTLGVIVVSGSGTLTSSPYVVSYNGQQYTVPRGCITTY